MFKSNRIWIFAPIDERLPFSNKKAGLPSLSFPVHTPFRWHYEMCPIVNMVRYS